MAAPFLRIFALLLAAITLAAPARAEMIPYCKQGKVCRALVIANSDYAGNPFPPLSSPQQNGERMAQTLEGLGFSVDLATNLDKTGVEAAFAGAAEAIRGADLFFIYYDGGGFQSDGNDYIAPVGMGEISSEAELKNASVNFQEAVDMVGKSDAGHAALIVLADSCRLLAGPSFSKGGPGRSKGLSFVDRFTPKETYWFSSSDRGQCGADTELFSTVVADALQQPGDIIRVLGQAGERVRLESNLGQSPQLSIQNVRGRALCLIDCEGIAQTEDLSALVTEKSKGECTGEWTRPETGEPRYALVIGNNGYLNWSALEQPTRDADVIAGSLEQTHFSVRKCYNLPREKLKAELDAYAAFLKQETSALSGEGATRRPSGFLYFSGHGASRVAGGETYDYLVPTDSTATMPNDLVDGAFNISAYADLLENVGANAVFVVIDACRNVLEETKGDDDFKAKRIKLRSGMLVAYATSADERAREHSGYARLLSEYMLRPGERASIAFEDVGIAIREESESQQIPVYENQLRTAWKFVP